MHDCFRDHAARHGHEIVGGPVILPLLNERYLPLNLPEEYQENGISVVFEGVIREDMYTIQQWGTPLDITMIQEKS